MRVPRVTGLNALSVAIIGGGAGGICMGAGLRMAGVERFTIYEQSNGIGGTWWDNVYPGAEVDTPQPFYSFSFNTFDFTRDHVQQPELLAYLENTADKFHLRDNLRLNCRVHEVTWDDNDRSYVVRAEDGSADRYDVVVSAVGLLNNPRYPDWPGLEEFTGVKFHSSRWNYDCDIRDRVVAVVGTGSTAAQIVPAIAPEVRKLYVYQRQPGWVVPKGERVYDAAERAELLTPALRRLRRSQQYLNYEKRLRAAGTEGTQLNKQAQDACLQYIDKVFAERPDLAKMVTPSYPFGGKRPVQDSNFYPALLRDNVELIPHPVVRITPTGIVDETGTERSIDVLVMCTGFTAAEFLTTLEVRGRSGRTLREVWNGSPYALLGMMVPDFPNFYMLYGPNTNGAPIMFLHERQVEFVLGNLARMARRGVDALEVREDVTRTFNSVLDKRLQKKVVTRYRVHNYAFSESGREVIGWGEGMTVYWALMRGLRPIACRRVSRESGLSQAPGLATELVEGGVEVAS
jgi:cation diffusion facilitator CzcD-associated flavoprotein CzcO